MVGIVDILFRSAKLQEEYNDLKKLTRQHGRRCADLIRRRLDDIEAAASLAVLRNLPGRYHELTADRRGQLSVDLEHPYRLILEPANEPPALKADGGIDWEKTTAVRVVGVEDTHG